MDIGMLRSVDDGRESIICVPTYDGLLVGDGTVVRIAQ